MDQKKPNDIAIYMSEMVVDAYLEEDKFKDKHSGYFEKINLIDISTTDTQCFFLESEEYSYLIFRGTEFKFADIFSDIKADKEPWDYGKIHRGFLYNSKSAWPEIKDHLNKDKKIVLAGHSLGGALAVVTAAFCENEGYMVEGVYTFGQPRVGDHKFKNWYNERLKEKTFRFVNENDLVSKVPIALYFHVGKLKYIDSEGNITDEFGISRYLMNALLGFCLYGSILFVKNLKSRHICNYAGSVMPRVSRI